MCKTCVVVGRVREMGIGRACVTVTGIVAETEGGVLALPLVVCKDVARVLQSAGGEDGMLTSCVRP